MIYNSSRCPVKVLYMQKIWFSLQTVAVVWSHFLCKMHTPSFPVHLCVFNQCRAVALDRQTYTQTGRQTGRAGQGLVLLFSAEAWPGDCWLMQNKTRGWNREREREREGTREWVKAEARLMAREREREGKREREMAHKREGWEDGGRDIIEPVWVSRLTELQGAAPAHHCYCKFPSLYGIHQKVHLLYPLWYNVTHFAACLFLIRRNK